VATLTVMKTVGIKALKDNLSAYVRAAEAGETVQVTDRGKVVAELVPPRAPAQREKPLTNEEIMAQLVREGIATPGRKGPWKRPPRGMALASFEDLMKGLDADREDR
jgi:antitoxin (DNA-binding transcriptional repressor) of toxin-antitoxin stability system